MFVNHFCVHHASSASIRVYDVMALITVVMIQTRNRVVVRNSLHLIGKYRQVWLNHTMWSEQWTPRVSAIELIMAIPLDFIDNSTTRVLGLELTWFVLISVSCFLAIGAVLAALVICLCRQSTSESSDPHQSRSFIHIFANQISRNNQQFINCRFFIHFFTGNCDSRSHWYERINEIRAQDALTKLDHAVGKLASPCGQTRIQLQHTTQFGDTQTPSHLASEFLNMKPFDPSNLSQTTTSTTIVATAQKEEWFVWARSQNQPNCARMDARRFLAIDQIGSEQVFYVLDKRKAFLLAAIWNTQIHTICGQLAEWFIFRGNRRWDNSKQPHDKRCSCACVSNTWNSKQLSYRRVKFFFYKIRVQHFERFSTSALYFFGHSLSVYLSRLWVVALWTHFISFFWETFFFLCPVAVCLFSATGAYF